jgi:hypothetical protein
MERMTRYMRPVTGFVLALAVVGAAPAIAQEQAQPAQPAGMTFGTDAGIVFNIIKPDKTADFEEVLGKLKEALERSEDPVRKQQAAGWKVVKVQEPGPNNTVMYLFIMDPVVKDADYTVSTILAEAYPTEVQEMWPKFRDAYAGGQNKLSLQYVMRLGQP